ncbi:MAG: hypothetical protein K2L42_05105 [Clostridia bacterium]|nr:hypothetical protein [Clostridia bacterium]
MLNNEIFEWVDSGLLKSAYGGQLAIFCNRHGDTACMHFMKDYKCERNFYCPSAVFEDASKKGTEIQMFDNSNNGIRVRPAGFHNYNSVFNADDLISAGVYVQEIKALRENKN